MIREADEKISSARSLFLDANLFVLLVVGFINPNRIMSFKRTQAFLIQDFDLLRALLSRAKKINVTANVLTETDNLIRNLHNHEHPEAGTILRRLMREWIEIYHPSNEFLGLENHVALGITDAILIHASSEALILTTDFKLAGKIQKLNGNALNFNHLRGHAW